MNADGGLGEGEEGLAPVIPISARSGAVSKRTVSPRGTASKRSVSFSPVQEPAAPVPLSAPRVSFSPMPDGGAPVAGADGRAQPADAEAALLRKLRVRFLSTREARAVLQPLASAEESERIVERFVELGYLDDGAVAEQIVRTGSERKGQGRRAIAQSLSARGIASEVVDAALATLPDDDAERALEFARSKVRRVSQGDRETTTRRLVGQLMRRGYASGVAYSAVKQALDEQSVS